MVRSDADPPSFRLLDLEALEPGRICLTEAITIEASGSRRGGIGSLEYATLSHCWGTCKKLSLLMSNRATFCRGISEDQLPMTFRDAVYATRTIGLRWLWIDSLCIIQDSPNGRDWVKQASLMGLIYKHSYVSIAATSAEDDEGGLFFERDPEQAKPAIINVTKAARRALRSNREMQSDNHHDLTTPLETITSNADDEPNEMIHNVGGEDIESAWLASGSYLLVDQWRWRAQVTQAPLYSRAWTVQERLLAPRVLNFASDQLYWECETLEACESAPEILPRATVADIEPFKSLSPYRHEHGQVNSSDTDGLGLLDAVDRRTWSADVPANPYAQAALNSVFNDWASIVETYSRGSLTHVTDKLVALAGISQEMEPLMRCSQYAGLWARHLERQLTWRTYILAPRPEQSVAPSWSWAAVQTPVVRAFDTDDVHQQLRKRHLIEVLEAHVEAKQVLGGPVHKAQVTGGYLRLRARLFHAHVSLRDGTADDFQEVGQFSVTIADTKFRTATLDATGIDLDRDFWCFPVAVWYEPNGVIKANGLILESLDLGNLDGPEQKVYQRIGCFDAYFEEDDSDYSCLLQDEETGCSWDIQAEKGWESYANADFLIV